MFVCERVEVCMCVSWRYKLCTLKSYYLHNKKRKETLKRTLFRFASLWLTRTQLDVFVSTCKNNCLKISCRFASLYRCISLISCVPYYIRPSKNTTCNWASLFLLLDASFPCRSSGKDSLWYSLLDRFSNWLELIYTTCRVCESVCVLTLNIKIMQYYEKSRYDSFCSTNVWYSHAFVSYHTNILIYNQILHLLALNLHH